MYRSTENFCSNLDDVFFFQIFSVPKTELIGDSNRFVKADSQVALRCIVRGTLEPPTYIIWFKGKSQVTDENKNGWYTEIDRNIFGNATSNQNTVGGSNNTQMKYVLCFY